MSSPRVIPSIEQLLQRPALAAATVEHGRDAVVEAARAAADHLRASFTDAPAAMPDTAEAAGARLEARILAALDRRLAPSLRPVINATGVVLHTNLGRAPLAADALARAAAVGAGYCNLEYDLDAGRRGHRHVHAERLLCELTGAETALVVNNNAAATLVVLAALASGREVIVSRGELVEIGGGFRIPDVMTQSGAILREVGTTNRTRVSDYGAAISARTALLLRVHPSNFRIEGFTERPPLDDLVMVSRRTGVPLFEDLGSGWLGLGAPVPAGLADEPDVAGSLRTGADVVAFSGDKILGGPQAGIVVGRRALLDRVRSHPLMRAVRADKLAYAALEATLMLWARAPARHRIPLVRMLTSAAADLEARARALAAALPAGADLIVRVQPGLSTIGGGSAPASSLPTTLVAVRVAGRSATSLCAALRAGEPPVVARIEDDDVIVDPRTVAPDDDAALVAALRAAIAACRKSAG